MSVYTLNISSEALHDLEDVINNKKWKDVKAEFIESEQKFYVTGKQKVPTIDGNASEELDMKFVLNLENY